MKKLLLLSSLFLCTGLDRFRHLLDEWPEASAKELKQQGSGETESIGKPTRHQRWSIYQRWRRLSERVELLQEAALKDCGSSVQKNLAALVEMLHQRTENFIQVCLDADKASLESCQSEDQRISEAENGFLNISKNLESCLYSRIYRGASKLEQFDGFINLPFGFHTNFRQSSPAESGTPAGADLELNFKKLSPQNNTGASFDWLTSLGGNYRYLNTSLFSFDAESSLELHYSLMSVNVGLHATRKDAWLRPAGETPDSHSKFGVSSKVQVPLGRFVFKPGYSWFYKPSSENTYTGTEQNASLEVVIDQAQHFSRTLIFEYGWFSRSLEALMPSWQRLSVGLLLSGPLEWGGEGELDLGFEERRDEASVVKFFPRIIFEMSSEKIPGFSWKSERFSFLFPKYLTAKMKFYLRPETTYWSSMAQVLGAEPALVWSWDTFRLPMEFLFKYQDHLSVPGNRRKDWTSGIGLHPTKMIGKAFSLGGDFTFTRSIFITGAKDDRLWMNADSYIDWYFGAFAKYEF